MSGWCAVALIATAASDIKVEGLRDSLAKAVRYIEKLGPGPSYGYQNRDSNPSDVHAGIGTLIMKLYGEEEPQHRRSRRLPRPPPVSRGCVPRGRELPALLRLLRHPRNYLRGGFAWEAWRNVMIRQLLNLQNPDGSWQMFGSEHGKTRYAPPWPPWSRMCLNEVPNYLKQEVRGF